MGEQVTRDFRSAKVSSGAAIIAGVNLSHLRAVADLADEFFRMFRRDDDRAISKAQDHRAC